MSVHEPSDGIAEEVERHIQMALGAAALAAQRIIEARRQALAEAQAHSQSRAGELRAQLDRDRALARARVQAVHNDRWWENAEPEQIADMNQTVAEWRDPALGDTADFDAAHARMEQEVNDRWGLDLNDVATLTAADDATAARQDAAAVASTRDTDDALADAQTAGRDTSTRRDELRDRLTAAQVPDDAAQARLLADTAQPRPVAEALSRDQSSDQEPARSHARSVSRPRQRTR